MEGYIISGIQQIGLGVPDVQLGWKWVRKTFGFDVPIFQDAGDAPFMTKYTGGNVQSRTATLAVNLMGGGGFEIWQYTSRRPQPPDFTPCLGDLGIFAARIKARDINAAYSRVKRENADILRGIQNDPAGTPCFFVQDPFGNLFQVIEDQSFFMKKPHATGGVAGCMIGVSDIDNARNVYTGILGYDTVEYDTSGTFDDLEALPGGSEPVRRVLLGHSEERKGAFSRLLGPTKLELIQSTDRQPRKIFENRLWGDLGFIHLCFDVRGFGTLEHVCKEKGAPYTVSSGDAFDMGEASGPFSYIEDPDGTLIEFVETHKIPINKAKGKYLNLLDRDPEKPLANVMLKALRFGRVKE
jgi:catechol 2,3-dioxygenase-like lactoylglutathione lyase family enzyme